MEQPEPGFVIQVLANCKNVVILHNAKTNNLKLIAGIKNSGQYLSRWEDQMNEKSKIKVVKRSEAKAKLKGQEAPDTRAVAPRRNGPDRHRVGHRTKRPQERRNQGRPRNSSLAAPNDRGNHKPQKYIKTVESAAVSHCARPFSS